MLWLVLLLLLSSSNADHILRSLHWLKVQERIEYKVISTTYRLLQSSSPRYLRDLITVQPSRSTRSSTLVTVLQPPVQTSLRSQTALFAMVHLTCGTSFLLLLVFLITLVHHRHQALLHPQILILN